ncbi:DUF5677 domain-containing protein [Cupriavidus sp. TMH.W2]|uniref:DUF5677 domain-containing protein n=1 Tax=Cupriavidus sp. TMH.W2 TaxID=3434465 RepID=UPI003D77C2CD
MSDAPHSTLSTMEQAGYLSGEAAVLGQHVRQQYGTLLRDCAMASRTAMAILCAGVSGPESMNAALAAWLRSISACQAGVLLAERGMVSEASAILRTGFEHLFYAMALLKDPTVLDRMRDQDLYERQHTVRRALADADVGTVISAEQREALQAVLQRPGGNLRISAFQAAEIAGLAAIFQTTYRQLSLVGTHANYTSVGVSFGASLGELQFVQPMDELPLVLGHIQGCLQLGSGAFLAVQTPNAPGSAAEAPPPAR